MNRRISQQQNQQQSQHSRQHERRDYFRIEDTVLLRYIEVDRSLAQANQIPAQFSDDLRFSLMQQLHAIDSESSKYLRSITQTNSDLEAYLKLLNKKIETLASALINSVDPVTDQQKIAVSLSEGGVCFTADNALAVGSFTALQLTLLPTYVTLVLFTEIADCSAIKDGFRIVMSFVHLKDADRQQLAKHIMQWQLAAKRKHQLKKD